MDDNQCFFHRKHIQKNEVILKTWTMSEIRHVSHGGRSFSRFQCVKKVFSRIRLFSEFVYFPNPFISCSLFSRFEAGKLKIPELFWDDKLSLIIGNNKIKILTKTSLSNSNKSFFQISEYFEYTKDHDATE